MRTKTYLTLLSGVTCVLLGATSAQAGFQWTAPTNIPAANAPSMGTAMPRVPAAPVAPVASEGLDDMSGVQSAGVIPTTPDGPISAAPVYGQGPQGAMTNDPITWNAPYNRPVTTSPSEANGVMIPRVRGPQSVLPAETQPLYPTAAPAAVPAMAPAPQITYTAPAPVMATPIPAPAGMVAAAPMIASSTTTTTTAPVYGSYDVAQGFGTDLPLVMAIRQVVPASYGFVFDDGINLSTSVSWQGGRPWNVVLQDMLTPLGLRAAINGTVVSIVPAAQNATMQQVAMNGPAVSTDIMNNSASAATMAPVMTPAIYQPGPAITATPAATSSGSVDLGATTTWTAPRNSTLRSILEIWSKRVGVELYWASEYDYPVQSAVSINGSFEEAVQTLLKGLNESKPRPLGRLHPNLPNGPAVLVIETRQNSL